MTSTLGLFTDERFELYEEYKKQSIKITALGESNQGKSVFLHRVREDQYRIIQPTTMHNLIRYNFFANKYHTVITNNIWDTSGTLQYTSAIRIDILGTDGIFLFISIQQLMNENEEFDNLEKAIKKKIQFKINVSQNIRNSNITYYFLLSKMDLLPQIYDRKEFQLKIFRAISKLLKEWQNEKGHKLYQCTKLYGSFSSKQDSIVQIRAIIKRMSEMIYLQKTQTPFLLLPANPIKLNESEQWGETFLRKLEQQKLKLKLSYYNYDYSLKILLVGSENWRTIFKNENNYFYFDSTLNSNYLFRLIQIGNSTVRIQISILQQYTAQEYKQAHGIIFIYDIANNQSFSDIQKWVAKVNESKNQQTVRLLVGNKLDIQSVRQIKSEDGYILSKNLKMQFLECSIKENINIDQSFQYVAKKVISNPALQKAVKKQNIKPKSSWF